MIPALRPKAEQAGIKHALANLAKEPWMTGAKRWWTQFLFHFTDIRNAIDILREGQLLSRASLEEFVDVASPEVISKTNPSWQQYVRLYWRPRTPTQYRNEGLRPASGLALGSHCPVPIYFLFDAGSILSRSDSRFIEGNAAKNPHILSTVEELTSLPFRYIYHDTPFTDEERDTIVFHRNAEVLVPDRLDLSSVRAVVCRSQAEYQTLLHLLPKGAYASWAKRITVRPDMFFREWTYVQRVALGPEWAEFRFNRGHGASGPFNVRAEVLTTRRSVQWSKDDYWAKEPLRLNWGDLGADYALHLYFDDNLAFADRFQDEVLPF